MEERHLTGFHDFALPLFVHLEHMVGNELAFRFSG